MLVLAREGACPRAGDDGRREDLPIRCRGRAGQAIQARLQAEGNRPLGAGKCEMTTALIAAEGI